METKICTRCKKDKILKDFSNDKWGTKGVKSQCKQCRSDIYKENPKSVKEKARKYHHQNKEKQNERRRKYYHKNRDMAIKISRQYYQEHKEQSRINGQKWREKNPEKNRESRRKSYTTHKKQALEQCKAYRIKNRKEINKRFNAKRKSDVNLKIKLALRSRLAHALNGELKAQPTLDLLGCSIDFFKQHLESQFTDGMSWDNYGLYGWHIDHKKPCAKFNLTKPEEQKKCFHYTNLQPLWAKDNLSKGSKYKEHTC